MRDATDISARRSEVLAKCSAVTECPVQIDAICSKSNTATNHGGLMLISFTCLPYNIGTGQSGVFHGSFPMCGPKSGSPAKK
jgi:hypothetical protein